MNYEIKYDCAGDSRHITETKKWLLRVVLVLFAIVFCAVFLWSFNGNWSVTVDAMEDMAEAIRQGSDIADAFSSFCLDILWGADVG